MVYAYIIEVHCLRTYIQRMESEMDATYFRGWLGADPEQIDTESGVVGVKFRLGVNDSYLSSQGEWVKRETVWVPCEAWRKPAETALPVLSKGCAVIVVGKWRAQVWADEEGRKKSKNVFNVESIGLDLAAMEVTGVSKRQAGGKAEAPAAAAPAAPAPAAPAEEAAPNPFLVGDGK